MFSTTKSTNRGLFCGKSLRFEALEDRRLLATFTVMNTADSGTDSLRAAVIAANSSAGSDTIIFHPSLNGQTITLNSEISIADHVIIDGIGSNITIDASGNDPTPAEFRGDGHRIFKVDDGTDNAKNVTIMGLILTGGDVLDESSLLSHVGEGGAIYSRENLTIENCIIRNNAVAAFHSGVTVDSVPPVFLLKVLPFIRSAHCWK